MTLKENNTLIFGHNKIDIQNEFHWIVKKEYWNIFWSLEIWSVACELQKLIEIKFQ